MKKQIAVLRDSEIPRKNSVGHADSVEKILGQIALLSPDTVTYGARSRTGRERREVVFDTKVDEVLITPSLFRKFICTDGCTACCQKFTLDYIPSEFFEVENKEGFSKRVVNVNGRVREVWTNDQNQNPLCDFLRVERPGGGLGCANYRMAPLSCISAPQLQFIQMRPGKTYVLKKPFGRAWAMTPTPQCQFVEFASVDEVRTEIHMMTDILDRFYLWADYFGIRILTDHVVGGLNSVLLGHPIPEVGEVVWTSA